LRSGSGEVDHGISLRLPNARQTVLKNRITFLGRRPPAIGPPKALACSAKWRHVPASIGRMAIRRGFKINPVLPALHAVDPPSTEAGRKSRGPSFKGTQTGNPVCPATGTTASLGGPSGRRIQAGSFAGGRRGARRIRPFKSVKAHPAEKLPRGEARPSHCSHVQFREQGVAAGNPGGPEAGAAPAGPARSWPSKTTAGLGRLRGQPVSFRRV